MSCRIISSVQALALCAPWLTTSHSDMPYPSPEGEGFLTFPEEASMPPTHPQSVSATLDDLHRIGDFSDLRRILSASATKDAYCRSAIYFAFTGRGNVWTMKCNERHLILLRHPNIDDTLLVFFPFASSASELMEQIEQLSLFLKIERSSHSSSSLGTYSEVLLARIPEKIADKVLAMDSAAATVQHINEEKLDWAYPSYDLCVKGLVKPQGPEFSIYRNKIRKFCTEGIEVITAKEVPPDEVRVAVRQINESWIRTKLKSGTSIGDQGLTAYELTDPYDALARLSEEVTSDIDGIFLKRDDAYIAFSLWERPRIGDTVPSFAAMTSSYEPGLSEYLHRCIADRVKDRYKYICIGGSETEGLDRFKRKFAPVNTHRLRTMRLLLETGANQEDEAPEPMGENAIPPARAKTRITAAMPLEETETPRRVA
jgi:hypothetical protein